MYLAFFKALGLTQKPQNSLIAHEHVTPVRDTFFWHPTPLNLANFMKKYFNT